MVNFYVKSVEDGMKIGADAAAFVSEKFIKPIKIEFEKVNIPFALEEPFTLFMIQNLFSGIFPVFVNQQKKIRRFILHQAGEIR